LAQLLLAVVIHSIAGGVGVVAFALIAETLKPKDFAGVFSAAPSIALASLVVTVITVGSAAAARSADGMVAGALGMLLFCALAVLAVRRQGAGAHRLRADRRAAVAATRA
jgi:Protein of unknown function (DUF3147)